MALPVSDVHRGRSRGAGPPAEVHDVRGGCEEHMPARRPNGCAEVDVFRVKKVPLVQEPHFLGIRAADEQAGAADPLDIVLALSVPLDPASD